ncbi:ATP-dependent DNA helicase RecG [Betaproteobacteria bacterium]|nr:ATP-dependent DNA helicase RecG [Betaproteobacteria bacterium]GHU17356.1 ATP-dependent DNA helicase RecG [Betaproteobacteria bacterium]
MRGWPEAGSRVGKLLARLDIHRPEDLIVHLPLRYEDETRLTPIADLLPGVAAQVEAEVVTCEVVAHARRQLLARLRDDAAHILLVRWLNFYPSLQKQLAPGRRVRVFGEARGGFLGTEMVHPRLQMVEEGAPLPQALTPVYPTTAGLGQASLRHLVEIALASVALDDPLPAAICRRLGFPAFDEAIRYLHHPPPDADAQALADKAHPAWQRVKFEELLVQQLSLRRAYNARRAQAAVSLPPRHTLLRALLDHLPFDLTAAQRRVTNEIAADLAAPHPMQRLLQGDVGSGKTIVAACAMLQAAENGCQAALMAPTEILAEQHYRKLSAWFAPLGIDIAWLSGSRKKRAREAELARLQSGECLLAVGTLALIEDPVSLPRLALAVIDEQHRFGVRQRFALREKNAAGQRPHMLMMSATPIPRTLAMTHYADLDISVLDELPPGRTPIHTRLVSAARREEIIARLHAACLDGCQAYWVCPLIEESETLQLKTAVETWETLCAALPELRIGLIHSRLKADEKAATMAAFAGGELHVLVATTVIEVGVDVPRASLMVIEHAERFGLAQLHQLRGRVGRGAAQSACVLIYEPPLSAMARARLKVIYEQTDGFAIAREDLRIRGPGEFVGARQSGLPLLRYADLELDADMIDQARESAEELLATAPEAVEELMARWLGGREGLLRA